jgi:catechol 2,3-dioxygenase-like lactoylglutathione lyase family enzyme
MTSITSLTLGAADPAGADAFYRATFGRHTDVRVRPCEAPPTGFRGFTLSLTVTQPATVRAFLDAAVDAGATPLKPAAKSLWGYGGVVQAPDGAIWKVATSARKDTDPADRRIEDVVLLLGPADVAASKRFYVEHGLTVGRSFGSKYVEFAMPASPVKLALYGRRALAKAAGVAPEPTGAPGIVLGSDGAAFTDPDGFAWQHEDAAALLGADQVETAGAR